MHACIHKASGFIGGKVRVLHFLVFSKSEIRWGESFMYEGVVGTRGLIMWSRKAEMCSVGPL